MNSLNVRDAVVRTALRVRESALRAALRRAGPAIDDSPTDGGRGDHPLGAADLAPGLGSGPDALALASLGQAALLAGKGDPQGLVQALADLAIPSPAQAGTVACRLIHLAAIASWATPDAAASARIGGAAQAHIAWLKRERPLDERDPDATLAAAALLIAARTWPALPSARDTTAQALTLLPSSARAMLGSDGAPIGDPSTVARALWGLALARAWGERSGVAMPDAAMGAFLGGSTSLWRLAGDSGRLPATGDPAPALLPLGSVPLPLTLRSLAIAWGLEDDALPTTWDPAIDRLLGRPARLEASEPALSGAMGPDGAWALWPWRDTGLAVAHSRIKGNASRGWFRASDGRVQWDLDDRPLVVGQRGPACMVVARVDGPQARVIAIPPGTDAKADERPERDISWRQARMVVVDRGVDRISWELGPDWSLEPGEKGEWLARHGGRTLVVKLDEESWRWSVSGRRIEGQGEPTATVRSIFELR